MIVKSFQVVQCPTFIRNAGFDFLEEFSTYCCSLLLFLLLLTDGLLPPVFFHLWSYKRQCNFIHQMSQWLFSSFGDEAGGVNLQTPQIS